MPDEAAWEIAPDDLSESPIDPRQRLWQAVVARAWLDAFEATDRAFSNKADPETGDINRQNARRWLTLNFDPWRYDREWICDLGNICPERLLKAARKRLALAKDKEAKLPSAEMIKIDSMFAKLLEDEEKLEPCDLDAELARLAAMEGGIQFPCERVF